MGCTEDNNLNEIEGNSISKNSFENASKSVITAQGKFFLVKFDEWGRKSKNCSGWGLCNAKWFQCTDAENNQVDCLRANSPGPNYGTPLKIDEETNQHYVEILFDHSSTSPTSLIIDDDIVLNFQSELGFNLIFKAGSYPFIPYIGVYGGYKIILSQR